MNLQTTINFEPGIFWRWWINELSFLVPAQLKHRLSDFNGRLYFTMQADELICEYLPNSAETPQAAVVINDASQFQSVQAQHPQWAKSQIILLLTEQDALQRIIELPAAALENLQQVVGFELDRYTPFRADQVYYAASLLSKSPEFIQVRLVMTPKSSLEPQLQRLQNLGVNVHQVLLQTAQDRLPTGSEGYNLLPDAYRARASLWKRWLPTGLSVLIMLLALLVLILPVWQEKQAVDWLKLEYKALEKPTQAVEEQQQAIDRLKTETQSVIEFKQKAPKVLAILNELTHVLDDATWLNHLQYSERHLQVQGQSRSASALIARLEASAYFQNVNFVSPLTQDKTTGLERFQISMDVIQPDNATLPSSPVSEQSEVSGASPTELEPGTP